MGKINIRYKCTNCGLMFTKWIGQCHECQNWNTIVDTSEIKNKKNYLQTLEEIKLEAKQRLTTGLLELDHVLGGGLVEGSVILLGGNPGIGKSTIILQTICYLAKNLKSLYITGEESLQQIAIRAKRLDLPTDKLKVMTETNIETIISTAYLENPRAIVIDSIQTLFTKQIKSTPGSISQIRESASLLIRYAKTSSTVIFIIGHVTKDGTLAGPHILEHMVDTVLYFESEYNNKLRLLRSVKNRFGSINELGVFVMTPTGLTATDPQSEIFISRKDKEYPGRVIIATLEGTRPMLVEIQALVDDCDTNSNPRRLTLGIDQNRLSMLLAVLNKHLGIKIHNKDIFINVVGGIKIIEPAADLALIAAIISSVENKPLSNKILVFGEVCLSGAIIPVYGGNERIKLAKKHGFTSVILPNGNFSKDLEYYNLNIIILNNLNQILRHLF